MSAKRTGITHKTLWVLTDLQGKRAHEILTTKELIVQFNVL